MQVGQSFDFAQQPGLILSILLLFVFTREQTSTKRGDDSSDEASLVLTLPALIGIIAGALCLCVLCGVGLFIVLRRRKNNASGSDDNNNSENKKSIVTPSIDEKQSRENVVLVLHFSLRFLSRRVAAYQFIPSARIAYELSLGDSVMQVYFI